MAACAVLPLYALLVNSTVPLTATVAVTASRRSGAYPAVFPGELANVIVTIGLPVGEVTTGGDYAGAETYRLRVDVVVTAGGLLNLSTATLTPATLQPLTNGSLLAGGKPSAGESTLSYIVDFKDGSNASTSSASGSGGGGSLTLALALTFADSAAYGSVKLNATASLTPWSWLTWDLLDDDGWEAALFNGTVNLTSPDSLAGLDSFNISALAKPHQCSLVDGSFLPLNAWADVVQCSRCVYLNSSLALTTAPSTATVVNRDPRSCDAAPPNEFAFVNVSFAGVVAVVLSDGVSGGLVEKDRSANLSLAIDLPPDLLADDRLSSLDYLLRITIFYDEIYLVASAPQLDLLATTNSIVTVLNSSSKRLNVSSFETQISFVLNKPAIHGNTSGRISLVVSNVSQTDRFLHGTQYITANFSLTPWSWFIWNLNDSDTWEQGVADANNTNRTDLSQYSSWGALLGGSEARLPRSCVFVTDYFVTISSWSQVQDCIRCVYYEPSGQLTIGTQVELTMLWSNVAVTNSTPPLRSLFSIGESFHWSLVISHVLPESTRSASNLLVTLDWNSMHLFTNTSSVEAVCVSVEPCSALLTKIDNMTYINTSVPLAFGGSLVISGITKILDDYPMDFLNYLISFIKFSISYDEYTPNGLRGPYTKNQDLIYAVRGIQLENLAAENPPLWKHNEQRSAQMLLKVPVGTAPSFFVMLILNPGNKVSVVNYSLTITPALPTLTVSDFNLSSNVRYNTYTLFSSRMRLANSLWNGTNPTLMSANFTYYIHPNTTKGEVVNLRFAIGTYFVDIFPVGNSKVAGPDLAVNMTVVPNSSVQAGDVLQWMADVAHQIPVSNEDAVDLQISVVFEEYFDLSDRTVSVVGIQEGSSYSVHVVNSSTVSVAISTFYLANTSIAVSGTVLASNRLPVTNDGIVCRFQATVSYRQAPDSYVLKTTTFGQINGRSVNATWQPLLSAWTPGYVQTMSTSLLIPSGTIRNIVAELEMITSNDTEHLFVSVLSVNISRSTNLLTFTEPLIVNMSTSNSSTIKISLSDVVHLSGSPSPATLRFMVTYKLLENVTPGQNISFRVTLNLGLDAVPWNWTGSTVVAAPLLTVDCIVTPSSSQAGSILTWNATVQHAISSSALANELEILVTFDRYWERISVSSSPTGGNFAVTQFNNTNIVAYVNKFYLSDVPLKIGGQIKVSDQLPLFMIGYKASLSIRAAYMGVGLPTVPFVLTCSASSTSRNVTIVGSGMSFLPPSPSWGIGQPATGVATLRMPPGMANVYFEFVVTPVGTAPVDVLLSVETPTASGIGVIGYKNSPASTTSVRRRRANAPSVFTSPTLTVVVSSTINTSAVDVVLTNKYYPLANATPRATVTVTSKLVVSGTTNVIGTTVTQISAPLLVITKTGELMSGNSSSGSLQTVNYTITLRHDQSSTYGAADVLINDLAQGMVLINNYQAEPYTSVVYFADVNNVLWSIDYLPLGQTATFWYLAQPAGYLGKNLPSGETVQEADLTYSINVTSGAAKPSYAGMSKACVTRVDVVTKTYWSDHGYTFLLAVIGIIGGVGLVVIIVVVSVLVMKRHFPHAYANTVEPLTTVTSGFELFRSKARVTFESFGKAFHKGFNSLQDITQTSLEDSIVKVLTLRSRLRIGRELDCLDIKAASRADRQLEKARLESLLSALEALLRGMLHNGDISSRLFEDGKKKLKSSVDQSNKALETEYENMLNKTQSTAMAKYLKKYEDILKKHDVRKNEVVKKAQDTSSKEVQSILSEIDDERDAEVEELFSIGRLQQEEEAEKLKKELTLRKRIQLKECQLQLIQYVIAEAKLAPEQAQWLIQQHKENQASIEKMYDNRMLQLKQQLEEKLAKRRMLAESTQAENERQEELLKQIGEGQTDMLRKAKKIGALTPEELKGMLQAAMDRRSATIQALERERTRQEASLHEKLCQQKRKSLEAKQKENQLQYETLIQQQQQRLKTEPVDPLLLETEKLELLAQQDAAMSELETKMDEENAAELNALQAQLVDKAKLTLVEQERNLGELMKKEGLANQQVAAILAEHDQAVQKLKDVQSSQREKQETDLQAKLAQRRREWLKSLEEEEAEQEALRQEEERILQELMAKQIAMSEEEREQILKQYEKSMAKMENNLTFNRLQHRRILEEKLAQRKAALIEKVEHDLLLEQKSHIKQKPASEDDRRASDLALLKKQARDRLSALRQTENVSLDEDIEKVKLEMMAERAKQLREQEDHIGSLLVSLQLAKAKELAEIEEKQRAINALTTNLMEDLTDRGILNDPACQKVIERHQMDQEKLTRKLEEEREKHERMLKAKLQQRLQQREKAMVEAHEARLRSVMKGAKGGTAALLRRVAIMARNKTEMEDFKIRMEKEISQTLEDMKRQQITKKRRLVQELEMRFVSGLIKLGKLKRSELAECLKLLFPGKTSEELDQLIASLHDDAGTKVAASDDNQTSGSEDDLLATSSASMLKDRIQRAVMASYSSLRTVREEESEHPTMQTEESQKKTRSRKKKKLAKNMAAQAAAADSDEELLYPVSERQSDEEYNDERPGRDVAADDSGDETMGPKGRRKAKRTSDVTASESRKVNSKDRTGDRRTSSKALPPLKALPSRRVGPNGDSDYMT